MERQELNRGPNSGVESWFDVALLNEQLTVIPVMSDIPVRRI